MSYVCNASNSGPQTYRVSGLFAFYEESNIIFFPEAFKKKKKKVV